MFLKTDKDYVVPEDQRVNAEKKRRQMVLLEESIHAIKMGYNQRYLALRELKRRIVEKSVSKIEKLSKVNKFQRIILHKVSNKNDG